MTDAAWRRTEELCVYSATRPDVRRIKYVIPGWILVTVGCAILGWSVLASGAETIGAGGFRTVFEALGVAIAAIGIGLVRFAGNMW
ncbi:hypothetical protein BRD17_07720 [Halobacteriales archaeon SW_7_68_16]|nr:MAG: hypothetical protein BRD17_07720 [Halobacteriales archaeon SW_7_68_16]